VVWISAIVIMLGVLALLMGGGFGAWAMIIVGLGVGFYAKAMRFTFKRQSGHILYQGGSW